MLRQPDVTKQPIMNQAEALEAAALLRKMTGDICAVAWEDRNRHTIMRQEPGGKMVNG